MTRIYAVLLVCLFMAACGGQTTPIPVSTAPTPRPAPEIPTGWKVYSFIGSEDSICYPDTWDIWQEKNQSFSIGTGTQLEGSQVIYVDESLAPPASATQAEVVETLKRICLPENNKNSRVACVADGTLDAPGNPVYIVGTQWSDIGEIVKGFIDTYAVDGDRAVQLLYFGFGSPQVPDSAFGVLTQMAKCYRANR